MDNLLCDVFFILLIFIKMKWLNWEPLLHELFSFNWRINGWVYIFYSSASLILLYWIAIFLSLLWTSTTLWFILSLLLLIIDLILIRIIIINWIKRFHDMGRNWRNMLLLFIPFYDILVSIRLFFKWSDKWKNKYWEQPKEIKKAIKTITVILFIAYVIILFAKFPFINSTTDNLQSSVKTTTGNLTQLANPASIYCIQNSWTIETVTDISGWQSWLCHLPNGRICDERDYYRVKNCPIMPQSWTVDYFKSNIISILPLTLGKNIENLFSAFDTETGDLQQSHRKQIIQKITNLIKMNVVPDGQHIEANQITADDMEWIIVPNLCNLMKFYNILSGECPILEISVTTGTNKTGISE